MTTRMYETMMFPGEGINGGYAFNVQISDPHSLWVSPLVKLDITDHEEARREARRQVVLLRDTCEGLADE